MAWLPVAAQVVGTILTVSGGLKQADAAEAAGARAREAKEFEAAQLGQQAGQAQASAQRRSLEQRRRAQMVASRALAVSAASGAGASDPTIETIISDIQGEGAYRAGLELYHGEERARQMRMGAEAANYEGQVAERGGKERARAARISAFGSALSGAGNSYSLYSKYGMGGPQAANTDGWLDTGTSVDPRFA